MKFNKALLSLAVAGALATPIAANAAAKIVVNDTTVGLPTSVYSSDSTAVGVTQRPSAGIKAPGSYIASDDVTVDAVYVTPDNSPVNVRPISLEGPMPASGRSTVSVAYSTDVQLPDEGTLRFQIGGAAGGFNNASANSLVLVAEVLQGGALTWTPGGDGFDIGDTTASVAKPAAANGSISANTIETDFVEVGQSFDYADTDGDQDVDRLQRHPPAAALHL